MMNKIGIQLLGLLIVSAVSLKCSNDKTPVHTDEENIINKSEYSLKVGETFTIKLGANGSLGYINCWINKNHCSVIEETDKRYESSDREKEGYVGSGGSIFWTFKAVKPGIDTLKIQFCPTGRLGQDCQYFSLDSIDIANREGMNIQPEQVFLTVVKVK